MRFFFVVLTLLLGLTSAQAEIAGQNDPQFKEALVQWLQGDDDLAALTALSELAKADNRAAQVFLGRVNEAIHTHSHVTGPMERKARIALMRQPGGLSGKSWLKAASEDVPLAVAFLQAKVIREKPAAVRALLDMDEVTAALMPLLSIIMNGELVEAKSLLAHQNLPKHAMYLQALVDRDAANTTKYGPVLGSGRRPRSLGMTANTKDAATSLFLWEGFHWDNVEAGQDRQMIPATFPESLINDPHFAPLKALCHNRCKNDVPKCMRAIMIHQRGSTPIWITLSSPVETLLSTQDYHASPRVQADLVRLIRVSTYDAPRYYRSLDQCSYRIMYPDD